MGESTPATPLAASLIIDATPHEEEHDMPDENANGHAALDEDAAMLATMRERVEALTAQRDELQVQMDALTPHLRRYEKAILALEGKPLVNPGRRAAASEDDLDKPPSLRGPRGPYKTKTHSTGVGEERLARIEAAVRQMAAEQDDVTQVAVRAITGDNSSSMTMAFEALRQRNVIRLVRQQGNTKVFRLTREALAKSETAES